MVEVIVTDEFKTWYEDLSEGHQESVFHVVGLLEGRGDYARVPVQQRSQRHKGRAARAAREGSGGADSCCLCLRPRAKCGLLLGGDKTGDDRFYEWLIPAAEKIWAQYLVERDTAQRGGT